MKIGLCYCYKSHEGGAARIKHLFVYLFPMATTNSKIMALKCYDFLECSFKAVFLKALLVSNGAVTPRQTGLLRLHIKR